MRKDGSKTKEQLLNELEEMRHRIKELEVSETECKRSVEALEEVEEKYKTILNNAHDVIFQLSPLGIIQYVSPKVEDIYGHKPEELIGKHLKKTTPVNELPKALKAIKSVLSGKVISNLVINQLNANGEIVSMEITANPVRRDGKIIAVQGVMRDITERKRLEYDLVERVKELRCLYSIASIAERPRVTLDEFYQEVANLLPDAWQYSEITCARVIINNKRFETGNWKETEWKQSSDVKVHGVKAGVVEVCYSEERPPTGEGPFFIEERQLIDAVAERLGTITERKRLEEALRESEENLRSLLNSMEDLVFVIAMDGTFKNYYQPWGREDLYVPPSEFVGKNFKDVLPLDVVESMQSAMRGVETSGEAKQFDYVLEMKGKKLWYDARVSPIKDQSGAVKEVIAVVRNITEHKQLEEARMEQAAAVARAEEVQQSRQRIITMQESLRRDIAQQIHGTVQNRLIILMHRLADLERSSLSEQIAAEVADLRQKLEEVLEGYIRPISYRLFPSILRRGLVPALQSLLDQFETAQSIDVELSEELKRQERINPRFITERVRLAVYRITEEALTNATKHANASRITVKLELSSEGWLRLMVLDDGWGFDMESASAGLGTLMMQDYAEVVGGSCIINSTPGKGTEATATVPLAEPGAEYPERA